MTRRLTALDVYHRMTGLFFSFDTATTTTTTNTAAKGDKVIDVTSAAGFAIGDVVRIGDAGANNSEVAIIDGIAALVITMKLPFSRAIASAEVFTLLDFTDLGATDENGVNVEVNQDEIEVIAGTQQDVYLFIPGSLDVAVTFALRDFTPENLATAAGLDETDTAVVDANGVVLVPADFGTKVGVTWKFEGSLEGGEAVTGFIYSAKVVVVNQALQFAFGNATIIPTALRSIGNFAFLIE